MTAPDFRVEIPGVPRGAGRPRSRIVTSRSGRPISVHYTDSKTRIEQDVIRLAAQQVMGTRAPFDCPLEVKIVAYVPIPNSWGLKKKSQALANIILPTSKPDGDNILKFVDPMKQIVFTDDSRISDWHIWKRFSDRPRVVIEFRCLR